MIYDKYKARISKIAKSVGAYFMVDMAHIAGLVAAGEHVSPVPYADVVTTTTHKTLRGPRGGLILTNDEEIAKKINKAIFPGTQGGPLMHTIASKAVCFGEALSDEFKSYQAQIVKNAQALAKTLLEEGFDLVSGGTDNHSMLVDLRCKYPDLTGKVAEKALVAADITANKNMVPFDTRSAFQTSGIRLGTPAITTRGVKEDMMPFIAEMIETVLSAPEDEKVIAAVRAKVNETMEEFPLFAY